MARSRASPSSAGKLFPTWVLVILLIGPAPAAEAIDFAGSARLAATATDNRGIETDILEQQYTFSLFQQFTPYVSVRFGYQYLDFGTTLEGGTDFNRRSRQPLLELLYSRRRLSGRLAVFDQFLENTLQEESFERRSIAANLSWKPTRGPGFTINYQQDKNLADVSVFGRDVESRLLDLTAFYSRRHWTASYTFNQTVLQNQSNQFRSDQDRHEVRANASRRFWDERISIGFSGWASRLNRTTSVGEDTELAEPVPAIEGLFVVDISPEFGELEPNPTLNDGDFESPASPPIDIGGANTFRNIGVDLGITRPVSWLEIGVDTVSGTQVSWQVYRSRDNLVWEAIPGVTAFFDDAQLRYRIRFSETEDRFFKAVNISTNPVPQVFVTEVRALLDLDTPQTGDEFEGTLYRADLSTGFRLSRRVNAGFAFGGSTDKDVVAGLVRRDFSEIHATARLSIDLRRDLSLNLGYHYNDSENLREPILLRTVNRYSAALSWNPLPTVDAVLSAGVRDESEKGELIQSVKSVRLGLLTVLLPDLRLISDLSFSRLEDPFAGRDRDNLNWRETLEMQLLPSWRVSGSVVYSLFESLEGKTLLDRIQYQLSTNWNATPFLTLGGTWFLSDEGGRQTLRQSYNLSYAPGPKLSISAAYQGIEGSEGVATSTNGININYRLFRRFLIFANLSRSTSEAFDGESAEISSLRFGLRLSF